MATGDHFACVLPMPLTAWASSSISYKIMCLVSMIYSVIGGASSFLYEENMQLLTSLHNQITHIEHFMIEYKTDSQIYKER